MLLYDTHIYIDSCAITTQAYIHALMLIKTFSACFSVKDKWMLQDCDYAFIFLFACFVAM